MILFVCAIYKQRHFLDGLLMEDETRISGESGSEDTVLEALLAGFDFLRRSQLPSGEFPTFRWRLGSDDRPEYVKTVFITSTVLHCLTRLGHILDTSRMTERAIRFVLDEAENGLWRFFGRSSRIHFDVDTTCSSLASLWENGCRTDYEASAGFLLRYRNRSGAFNTWILDADPPFRKTDNIVDWVVNANVLFFYGLLNWQLPRTENYVICLARSHQLNRRSPYYTSPLAFGYFLSRAYKDGHNLRLAQTASSVEELVFRWGKNVMSSPLYASLSAATLINFGTGNRSPALRDLETILITQLIDFAKLEELPLEPLFDDGPVMRHQTLYGSQSLTMAILLEALAKSLGRR